jgi:hypothetical protein
MAREQGYGISIVESDVEGLDERAVVERVVARAPDDLVQAPSGPRGRPRAAPVPSAWSSSTSAVQRASGRAGAPRDQV